MVKKIAYVGGAILIFSVSSVATIFALSTLNPKVSSESTQQTSTTEPAGQASDTPASADQLPATDPNTSVSSENPNEQSLSTTLRNDAQVKNSTASIVTALNMYAANNRGAFPTAGTTFENFKKAYLTEVNLTNPVSGTPYSVETGANVDTKTAFHFQTYTQCTDGNTAVEEATSKRHFTVSVTLPSGVFYCLD